MPQRDRLGHVICDSLQVLGPFSVESSTPPAGSPSDPATLPASPAAPAAPTTDGGNGVVIKGAGAVTSKLAVVAGATATLSGPPTPGASHVTASVVGNVITLSVFGADCKPSSVPTPVNFIAIGS